LKDINEKLNINELSFLEEEEIKLGQESSGFVTKVNSKI
jgi:hypothetical protein